MAQNSKIEWTSHTFNPWRGCTKVSAGCKNCYAEAMSKRSPKILGIWGDGGTRVPAAESYWKQPLKWNVCRFQCSLCGGWNHPNSTICAKKGCVGTEANFVFVKRPRVFCASLADVFEDRPELIDPRHRLMQLIESTPNLDWLLLTKRPENVGDMVPVKWFGDGFPTNFWLGTSVENQEQADRRIAYLENIPATVRFLSCEPLLGDLNLKLSVSFVGGSREITDRGRAIHWVIAGGESGTNARPMHPDWARSLRDQCQAAGVPFFFKQWGEWKPYSEMTDAENSALYCSNVIADDPDHQATYDEIYGCKCRVEMTAIGYGGQVGLDVAFWTDRYGNQGHAGMQVFRVGKKAAGRLLDGRTWDEMPRGGEGDDLQ